MTRQPSFPTAFELFIGEAHVVVTSQLPAVARGLWAVWRSAAEPMVRPRQTHELSVRVEEPGVEVWLDGERVAESSLPDALPTAEHALYRAIAGWFEDDRAVLHGSLLAGADACVLLIGQSGAGKSSLAWSGVQRGYAYGGDEITVTDGDRVWGVPRAVLFDPTCVGNELPEVAAAADRQRYRFANWYGETCFLPICSPPEGQVLRAPRSLSSAHFVLLSHGDEPCFEPVSSLEVLAALHRECRGDVDLFVSGLGPARCHRLRWQHVDWAWQRLAPLVGRPVVGRAMPADEPSSPPVDVA